MSPTEIALAALRKDGWTTAIVERWNQYAKIRQDLFGWCDLLAIRADETLGVQVTSATHAADHRVKIEAEPRAALCVLAGWRVELWTTSTRRPEAGPCSACRYGEIQTKEGGYLPDGQAYPPTFRRCPVCRGTGKGKRPKTKRHHIRRERLCVASTGNTWTEVSDEKA